MTKCWCCAAPVTGKGGEVFWCDEGCRLEWEIYVRQERLNEIRRRGVNLMKIEVRPDGSATTGPSQLGVRGA